MGIIIGLIIVIPSIIIIFTNIIDIRNFDKVFGGICLLIIGLSMLFHSEEPKEPTALDVYRNKTTLKITYQDSIPVDTVVIFK